MKRSVVSVDFSVVFVDFITGIIIGIFLLTNALLLGTILFLPVVVVSLVTGDLQFSATNSILEFIWLSGFATVYVGAGR